MAALEPFRVDVPGDVLTDLAMRLRRVTVPTGVANYPGELVRSLRPHAERYFNVVHWTELPHGGHFPAMEVPGLFVADVRAFFRGLRC